MIGNQSINAWMRGNNKELLPDTYKSMSIINASTVGKRPFEKPKIEWIDGILKNNAELHAAEVHDRQRKRNYKNS